MNPARVAVVGAGITGLVAAHRLAEAAKAAGAPLAVTVLEASDRAGGHAWTTSDDGFLVEAGPNAFLHREREPDVLRLAEELGLGERLIESGRAARRRFVLRGGKLRRVPDDPVAFFTSGILSPGGKLRLLLEPWARRYDGPGEESVYEFARRRIGREAAEALVDAAVAGISAGDSRRLSVAAAFPLMVELERDHGGLILGFIARRGQGAPKLMSFDGGMETLVAALCQRLGGALRTACPVDAIARRHEGWEVRCGGREPEPFDQVVLAVAARRAATLVRRVDPQLAEGLAGFPAAGLAVVAMAFRESDLARPLDGYGYLVAGSERLATLGVLWESSIFPGRAQPGTVLLRAMVGGMRRPEMAAAPEDELIACALRELTPVLGVRGAPRKIWVRRWPAAITQYELGHGARLAAVREAAARHPGLTLCGTSYDGVAFGNAVRSGASAAERVLHALKPEVAPAR